MNTVGQSMMEAWYPKKRNCAFCGRYWHGTKLTAGLCPRCLLDWESLRLTAEICPVCGSFDSGDPCQGPCADKSGDTTDGIGSLNAIYAAAPYTGRYRQKIMSFKYNGERHLYAPLGLLMANTWRRGEQTRSGQTHDKSLEESMQTLGVLIPRRKATGTRTRWASEKAAPYLVPVPIHPDKEKQRGYNQSRLLAEAVSRETGFPIKELLVRSRTGQMQAGLDKFHRKTALDQVFHWNNAVTAEPGPAILVDDVVTTGATLESCGQILRENGIGPIWGLTFGGGSGQAMHQKATHSDV